MSYFFVVCEIDTRVSVKRVYSTNEECQDYFDSLVDEVHAEPENYRVLSRSATELCIEELGRQENGSNTQRKYTIREGEVADIEAILASLQDP
jgi:hypothetical protein